MSKVIRPIHKYLRYTELFSSTDSLVLLVNIFVRGHFDEISRQPIHYIRCFLVVVQHLRFVFNHSIY